MTRTPDIVVLAPGFLGFSRFGGFYYFADRVVAAIRGLLEEALGRRVPVVACATLPTDALARRQHFLVDYLHTLCTTRLAGVRRIHLVGHSTGGVDAQLLAGTTTVAGARWSARAQTVRRRIASVVTISAPHHGTGLADSRLARFGENPLRHPTAIAPTALTLFHLLAVLPREAEATLGLQVARPNDVLKFLFQIVRHRELIADLRPVHMAQVRSTVRHDPSIPLTCFVTGTVPRRGGGESDPFFRDLYGMTADGSAHVGSDVGSAVLDRNRRLLTAALAGRGDAVIVGPEGRVPAAVDLRLNDGIVNSARQLVDGAEPGQFGGFVVADHGDVIGHYDRQDDLIDGAPFNAGLFHSGARFGDDQFFELYRRVANAILRAVPRPVDSAPPRSGET